MALFSLLPLRMKKGITKSQGASDVSRTRFLRALFLRSRLNRVVGKSIVLKTVETACTPNSVFHPARPENRRKEDHFSNAATGQRTSKLSSDSEGDASRVVSAALPCSRRGLSCLLLCRRSGELLPHTDFGLNRRSWCERPCGLTPFHPYPATNAGRYLFCDTFHPEILSHLQSRLSTGALLYGVRKFLPAL